MKTILLTLLLCLWGIFTFAQGVDFKSITFEEAKALAQKENKMIFVEMSMSGCGPCIYMKDKIFVIDSIGKFYNDHFVNLYLNVSNNKEGEKLRKLFNVTAFPTFLFIDPKDGSLVHRSLGGRSPEETIAMAKIAQVPQQGSVYLNEQYLAGNRDYDLLVNYYQMCAFDRDRGKMNQVIVDMTQLWGADFKNEKMNDFFFRHVTVKGNPLAGYFLKNTKKMIRKFGKDKVFDKIAKLS